MFLEVLKFVTAWRCVRYKHAKNTKKTTRMSNERDESIRTMTGKSGSREKKRTFLSLLSKNNDENVNEKKVSWGPLWDSPTRIKKQKEEDKAARPRNTLAAFALTTPPNEAARERKNFVAKDNAEDENNNKMGEDQRSFLEASLGGGFSANATGDEDEEEETMKDETMTMAKKEKQNGGARPAAAAEKVGELLLSRTLASKPPMKGFAFIKSSEFEQFKENWQRQKETKGKKKTEHASMIPRGPPSPPASSTPSTAGCARPAPAPSSAAPSWRACATPCAAAEALSCPQNLRLGLGPARPSRRCAKCDESARVRGARGRDPRSPRYVLGKFLHG